jgi:hypothetical protein
MQASFSITNTNKYGDMGSLCRSPIFGVKPGSFDPFQSKVKEEDLIQNMIRLTVIAGKPKSLRVL